MGFGISHQQVKNSSLNEFLTLFNQKNKNDELLEYMPEKNEVLSKSTLGKNFAKLDKIFKNLEYEQIENKNDLIDKGLYGFHNPEITYISYLNHPTIQQFNDFLVSSKLTSKKLFLEKFSEEHTRIFKNKDIQSLVEKYKKDKNISWSENIDEIKESRLKKMEKETLESSFLSSIGIMTPYERFKQDIEIYYETFLDFYRFYNNCSLNKNSWILISMG